MTESLNMPPEIAAAVIKMMETVGYVQKKGKNEFHNYKYASIEDVLAKVQPALVEAGLVIVQNEASHATIGDALMEAVYDFRLVHKSGVASQTIRHTGLAGLRNSKGGYDDKALNKCHTSARKYFILALFQIPTGLAEDTDADEDKPHGHVSTARTSNGNGAKQAAPAPKGGKTTAADWANEAAKKVAAMKTEAEINAWAEANDAAMNKLLDVDVAAANALTDAIESRRDALNLLAAG